MTTSYYTNRQHFDISRRFSVPQRRFAWLLRVHPKKYHSGRRLQGPCWQRVTQRPIEEATTAQLEMYDKIERKTFLDCCNLTYRIAQERDAVQHTGTGERA